MYIASGTKAQSLSPRSLYFNERNTYFNSERFIGHLPKIAQTMNVIEFLSSMKKGKSSTKLAP